jgi:hypothetical protein
VNVDRQLVGVEPERLLHALQVVERVQRRQCVQDHAAAAVHVLLADSEQLIDILLLDPAPADLDFDTGDRADHPPAEKPT